KSLRANQKFDNHEPRQSLPRALLLDKKNQSSAQATSPTPALVKAVESNYVTCGGTHSYQNCLATSGNVYQDSINEYVSQAVAANYNQGNTGFCPQMVANQIRPLGFPPVQNNQNNFNRSVSQTDFERYVKANDKVLRNIQSQGQSTQNQCQNMQNQCQNIQNQYQMMQNQLANLTDMITKFMSSNMASSSGSGTLPSNTVTNPKEDLKGITTRSGVAYNGPTIPTPSKVVKQAFIGNKEKLSEMARTPMNEHCSTVILKKLPKKLGDPGKFLIPCEFLGIDECLALADLSASINLMPLSMWKELSLPELTPTCMTLELADRSVSKPIDIAKDVKVKVGMFYFPADFMVVDFKPDSRVPLILGRCFLKTGRALIDVHKGELTLRIGNEAITYNLDQTSKYSANYDQMTTNKIDVADEACEEYFQEVLGFSDVTTSGSPTLFDDPIVSTTSPTLTPFGESDFLLFEEANAFLDGLSGYFQIPIDPHDQEKQRLHALMERSPTIAYLSVCAMRREHFNDAC
nr:reverse transcriptase domain-containing protein [Tanacetum cinerariifolium]